MAIAAATIFEVASTGSDNNAGSDTNAGGFNPTNANFPTDLTTTANTGNTASPVVSSATYSFQAGDVNHWVFVQGSGSWTLPNVVVSGITITPTGLWAKISSVAAGAATLDAAIGHVVCYATGGAFAVSSVVGISTQGTPTAGKFGVDYSQGGTTPCQITDAVTTGASTTITSASNKFHKAMVGNLCYITGGTGAITAAVYEIVSDTGVGTIVVDRSAGLSTGTGATLNVGGCLASPGMSGSWHVAGNHIFIKNATYTTTTASSNVSGGVVTLTVTAAAANATNVFGYNSFRTDGPKTTSRPTFKAGVASSTLFTVPSATRINYLILDGNSQTTTKAISFTGVSGGAFYVSAKGCTAGAFVGTNVGNTFFCDATTTSTTAAFSGLEQMDFCVAWSNTITGFSLGTSSTRANYCLSVNNSGASSDGFTFTAAQAVQAFTNCTTYNNGRDGFRLLSQTLSTPVCINCLSVSNAGKGFGNNNTTSDNQLYVACFAYNNGTDFESTITQDSKFGCQVLTGTPFTNAAGNDFSLNNTAGAGAVVRAASFIGAFPGISTTTYLDGGAVQHQDTPVTAVQVSNVSVLDGPTRVMGY